CLSPGYRREPMTSSSRHGAAMTTSVSSTPYVSRTRACISWTLAPCAVRLQPTARSLSPVLPISCCASSTPRARSSPASGRRTAGVLPTTLLDITDVYDEFGFGQKTPYAIRSFLMLTQTRWKHHPRFVMLVGDASFDPKNNLGMGDFDLVPTKMIPTTYLKTD